MAGYVAPFRETSLLDSGRHHAGSKRIVPHRNLSESYLAEGAAEGGEGEAPLAAALASSAAAAASSSPAGSNSRAQGRAHSKRHLAPAAGSSRVADALAHATWGAHGASSAQAAPPGAPPAPTPRAARAVGGADSIVLGRDDGGRFASTHGIKEEALRVAADPEAQRQVRSFPMAGARPEPRGPRAARAVGGDDHTQHVFKDGAAPRMPSEGIDEAQRRSALEPAARQHAEAASPAGTRILRAPGLRVTSQAVGGAETGRLDWPASVLSSAPPAPAYAQGAYGVFGASGAAVGGAAASAAAASAAPAQLHASSEQRGPLMYAERAVGGRSAPYLPGAPAAAAFAHAQPAAPAARSSMGAILQQVPADAGARPGSSAGRGGVGGAARNASEGIAGMFSALAGVPDHGGGGGGGGGGAPARSPVRRAQPVGGVGNLLQGPQPGAPALPPARTGVRMLGSNASTILMG